MVQLTNKREIYDVSNQSESMKLSGQFTHTSDDRVIDAYFNVQDLQDTSYGSVNYSEMLDETVSIQFNNIPKAMVDSVADFINTTITAIKGQISA